MSTGQYEKLNQNSATFRQNIGSYSSATPFFKAIFNACQFEKFIANRPDAKNPILLLDAMSGPGKLGKDLAKMYNEQKQPVDNLRVFFNDKLVTPLAQLVREGFDVVNCDVRDHLWLQFDIIAVRYGLKDLPKDQIPLALESLHASLLPGGRLVIADMTAYSIDGQLGAIRLHSAKQEMAGRNPKTEGICHIPLPEEWAQLLAGAGFSKPEMHTGFTSDVETSQWKGQFSSKDTPELSAEARDMQFISTLNSLARELAQANPIFASEFNLRFEEEKVFVQFPILVISAEKD